MAKRLDTHTPAGIFVWSRRTGCISRNCGKDGCNQPDLGSVRNPMGRKNPEGLIHTLARASAASPWEKTSIVRTLKGFNIEGPRGKRPKFVVPFQARRIINRLPRAALRLPWASACGILSGFFRTRIFRFLSWMSRCRTEPGYSNFSKPSREFGGCTPPHPRAVFFLDFARLGWVYSGTGCHG
jgi:hypothetical protein